MYLPVTVKTTLLYKTFYETRPPSLLTIADLVHKMFLVSWTSSTLLMYVQLISSALMLGSNQSLKICLLVTNLEVITGI